jgi:hypothetical protein
VITGYSTALGVGLHRRDDSVGSLLRADAAACPGGVSVLAEEGQTLSWVAGQVCSGPPTDAVVFLGGGNDDLLSSLTGPRVALAALGVLHYRHRPLTPERMDRLFEETARWSLGHLDVQEAAIQSMGACARLRGARLVFVHDFLATDLGTGRGEARRAMLEARRRAVEAVGGRFVDLEHDVAGHAGVSWFNDFIHPSAVGHRVIARIIDQELRRAASDDAVLKAAQ